MIIIIIIFIIFPYCCCCVFFFFYVVIFLCRSLTNLTSRLGSLIDDLVYERRQLVSEDVAVRRREEENDEERKEKVISSRFSLRRLQRQTGRQRERERIYVSLETSTVPLVESSMSKISVYTFSYYQGISSADIASSVLFHQTKRRKLLLFLLFFQ